MPSSTTLTEYLDRDSSSRGSPNQLVNILIQERSINVQDLPDSKLAKLVEGLDHAVENLDPNGDDSNHCLFELWRVCGARKVLPKSHMASCAPLDVKKKPITLGHAADLHEGSFRHTKFLVKKLRVYSQGHSQNHSQNLESFYREVVLWKHIQHPNIVPFRGVTPDSPQLVFDWMENGGLMSFLVAHPNANRLGLLSDVAEGLNYLHGRNIIHGNIKGSDVLVDQHNRARIADFTFAVVLSNRGISCGPIESHNSTAPRWTAPEVLGGKASLSKKADVFSFAMLMIEVFSGNVPFEDSPPFRLPIDIVDGKRPQRPENSFLTDDAWKLIESCWKPKADSRPDIGTVVQALAPILFWSLRRFIESLPELQVALSQFYDSTGRESCIAHLEGAGLRNFINFLNDVLGIAELSEDLRQRTICNLREVCGRWAVLPDPCLVLRRISKVSVKPHAADRHAEVCEGKTDPAEWSGKAMNLCVKVIKSKEAHANFCGEVAVWVILDHQNIVQCFGLTANRLELEIVMEWMPNGQAMKYVQSNKAADRVSLLIDIAHGLEYLHSCGVVHGNLKQENILLDSEGKARLSDIGFAKLVPGGKANFKWAPVIVNGCRWTAPEVFQNGKPTKQSDVFSYGFIAAELFLGELLWEASDEKEVRSRISNDDRPNRPNSEKNAFVIEMWRMFEMCWIKDPETRTSISEALGVLEYLPSPLETVSYMLKRTTDEGWRDRHQEYINKLDEILDTGMAFPKERPKIINRLCKKCEQECSLPTSMVVTFESLQVDPTTTPVAMGTFGDVFRGAYEGRMAAVKRVRASLSNNTPHFIGRFCHEAVMWRHLRHPNILPLFAATFDKEGLRFALASKWMDNGNINDFIKKHDNVNRVQLLVDVAHGLQYLHDLSFVHADLKGANILIKEDHRACLADFGLSAITTLNATTTASGALVNPGTSLPGYLCGGTLFWMSPELLCPDMFRFRDTRPTTQSDCYALGMVIYEVLCGKTPYWDRKTGGHVTTLAIIGGARPVKPDNMAALGFTDGLWWTVECCWLKDRDMRPDVKAVLCRLDEAAWAWDMRRSPRISP